MSKQHYQILFAYNWYTAQRLLDKAALLDEAAYYANPGYGHGSIHEIFFHLLAVSHGWRIAFESGRQPARLQADGFTSLPAVRAGLAQEHERWQTLLAGVSEEEIDGPITLLTFRGEAAPLIYWRVLQHVNFHSMQHHSEIAQLLTHHGHSPGDIDFLFYAE
jgi:uncharacterized damage-inducible protein DinB